MGGKARSGRDQMSSWIGVNGVAEGGLAGQWNTMTMKWWHEQTGIIVEGIHPAIYSVYWPCLLLPGVPGCLGSRQSTVHLHYWGLGNSLSHSSHFDSTCDCL